MTDKQKLQHNQVNFIYWTSIKPYVKNEELYKECMTALFSMFIGLDDSEKKFTDEWWDYALGKMQEYPNKFRNTELEDFTGDLAIGFCNIWEYEAKGKTEIMWFDKAIGKAFLNEWERLRGEKENKEKTTG